ncbi:UNVERIFIED_CONTAM: Mitochondrial outer membrane protein porin 2 [Sesamum angustifolium]|uniref:Mitochondrial outer membrane protein porin 2 n=1 Tax=Sesamum angustifolium TaxID=2727405 RepID=A0AAW2RMV9_9LAMI
MSKGPGLFLDIGKKAKDLLTKDYLSDHKLSVSTYSESGVALTTTAAKKGGYSSGDVAAQYIYKNTFVDVKVDTESNLEFQYFHPLMSSSRQLLKQVMKTTSGKLTKYTAGITVTKPDSCASVILGDKGDTIKVSYIHFLDQLKRTAAVGEISRKFSTNENIFSVGGSYAIDSLTLLKMKLNNHGTLGAVLQHEVIRKSLVTISSEFDTRALDRTPKFGVSLALKP